MQNLRTFAGPPDASRVRTARERTRENDAINSALLAIVEDAENNDKEAVDGEDLQLGRGDVFVPSQDIDQQFVETVDAIAIRDGVNIPVSTSTAPEDPGDNRALDGFFRDELTDAERRGQMHDRFVIDRRSGLAKDDLADANARDLLDVKTKSQEIEVSREPREAQAVGLREGHQRKFDQVEEKTFEFQEQFPSEIEHKFLPFLDRFDALQQRRPMRIIRNFEDLRNTAEVPEADKGTLFNIDTLNKVGDTQWLDRLDNERLRDVKFRDDPLGGEKPFEDQLFAEDRVRDIVNVRFEKPQKVRSMQPVAIKFGEEEKGDEKVQNYYRRNPGLQLRWNDGEHAARPIEPDYIVDDNIYGAGLEHKHEVFDDPRLRRKFNVEAKKYYMGQNERNYTEKRIRRVEDLNEKAHELTFDNKHVVLESYRVPQRYEELFRSRSDYQIIPVKVLDRSQLDNVEEKLDEKSKIANLPENPKVLGYHERFIGRLAEHEITPERVRDGWKEEHDEFNNFYTYQDTRQNLKLSRWAPEHKAQEIRVVRSDARQMQEPESFSKVSIRPAVNPRVLRNQTIDFEPIATNRKDVFDTRKLVGAVN